MVPIDAIRRARMKICFFNRSYWPDQAATGQLLTELAEDLVSRHGCEVTVVAGRALHGAERDAAGLAPVDREVRRGVTILRANGTRFDRRRFSGRAANYLTYFASAAVAGFQVGRPDIVVSLTDPPILGLAARWTARRTGARFVFLCEDIFPEVAALLEDFHNDTVNRALDRVNRYLLRDADGIVALGDRMRRRLVEEKGADPSRVTVIHNWADCEAITPGPKDNAFTRAHGLGDRFVLMHSGNIGLSQNLDVLIEAAALLKDRARLVIAIVGDGAKREALARQAAGRGLANVRFFPYQPKELLHESFAAADAFLVSLKAGIEGYIVPSKLYGILAAGRPYIAAVDPTCEVATIAREYGCGLLAAPGDPGALAGAIAALHDDPAAARAMGQRARAAALQFDRRVAVAAYHSLFVRVAGLARAA
ncbi:MAG: glycosyltransferase family 4 protein [Acidobacteriia bacterium]|nr:glycosyltransferase family 4 protein [Terriglobia bacterium]